MAKKVVGGEMLKPPNKISPAKPTLDQLQQAQSQPLENNQELKDFFQPGSGSLGQHRAKSRRLDQELGKLSLTEKQAKILTFVKHHVATFGFPPTVRQIASYYSISAKAAHDHLRAIAKKGYLRLFPGAARGMELVHTEHFPVEYRKVQPQELANIALVPLVGSIAAGTPILAEENIEANLAFPRSFLPTMGTLFALRVKGDSMEKAGILDGDIAVLVQVVDIHTQVKNGDIVAAIIDGNATLKTFHKKKNRIELLPANDRYQPLILSEKELATIVGRLVGVYRRY